jgi:bifunctional DNA-binding transcriptional regulator/antitoxin component of YhaV-PrlF toxin-antitoxin module
MSAVTRIRPRYVVTLPRSIRKRRRVKVGDNVVWLPVSEREFLAVILPPNRYRVLAELMNGIELSREARLAAENAYFSSAAKKERR